MVRSKKCLVLRGNDRLLLVELGMKQHKAEIFQGASFAQRNPVPL